MPFVVGLLGLIAMVGIVMLLLWGIERIEARLRRMTPRVFNSWMQPHALAAIILVMTCIVVWPDHGQPLTVRVLIVPLMAASLAYLAPLAFGLVVAVHNPEVVAALIASAFRRISDRALGRLSRRRNNEGK
jgi:hypothetical protein